MNNVERQRLTETIYCVLPNNYVSNVGLSAINEIFQTILTPSEQTKYR